MCNVTGCGSSKEFPQGDYCCEKKEQCDVRRPCISTGVRQTTIKYRCPWRHDATPRINLWKCSDGHLCNTFNDPVGLACCRNHGGISVCPSNYPVMCDKPYCANGTDYCCEGSTNDCKNKYGGKERPCEMITQSMQYCCDSNVCSNYYTGIPGLNDSSNNFAVLYK